MENQKFTGSEEPAKQNSEHIPSNRARGFTSSKAEGGGEGGKQAGQAQLLKQPGWTKGFDDFFKAGSQYDKQTLRRRANGKRPPAVKAPTEWEIKLKR